MQAAGVKLVVPLVSQGELIGVLSLGPAARSRSTPPTTASCWTPSPPRPPRAAGRAAGPAAAGRGPDPRALRAGAGRRPPDPAEVPAQELPDLPGLAGRRDYRAGARGRRRLLRRDPAAGRPDRLRHRRRHRQGRAGRAGHGGDAQRPAGLGPAAGRPGCRPGAGQRAPLPGHAGEDVRHLPLRRARSGDRPLRFANAGHDLPYVRPPTARSSCGRRDAAGSDARHGLRGEGDRPRAGRLAAAAHRRHRRGPRPRRADVRVPAAQGGRRRPSRRRGDHRRVLADLRQFTGPDGEQEDDITMVTLARAAGAGRV